ncbi:MAG: DNA-directed polymerase [Thermoleophilia bacterium]|nr:DNA-directed polymerase [Thermoleophilia bacterium]
MVGVEPPPPDTRVDPPPPVDPDRRVIAHLDADAFYASIHLLEDPSLAGKPVIVAGDSARSIVTTANYEARKYGIGSAQPAARARMLCPHGVFVRPDFELYRRYSRQAMELMQAACDTIEPLSLDEAYLDITALERPVRAVRELVARIHAETGLRYSVGIGPNKLCAKVLSDHRKPNAFNVASREQCCELFADASPRLIPGFGPKTVEALEIAGIRTIADVRDADPEALAARFGPRRGAELQARARFEHEGIVHHSREPKSTSEETTFEHDIGDLEELEGRMRELSLELCERLQGRDLAGRTVGIKVRLADFTTITRARTLGERTNDVARVSAIACELLREYDPPQPVRLIGVRVAGFEAPEEGGAGRGGGGDQLRLPFPPGVVGAWG